MLLGLLSGVEVDGFFWSRCHLSRLRWLWGLGVFLLGDCRHSSLLHGSFWAGDKPRTGAHASHHSDSNGYFGGQAQSTRCASSGSRTADPCADALPNGGIYRELCVLQGVLEEGFDVVLLCAHCGCFSWAVRAFFRWARALWYWVLLVLSLMPSMVAISLCG